MFGFNELKPRKGIETVCELSQLAPIDHSFNELKPRKGIETLQIEEG